MVNNSIYANEKIKILGQIRADIIPRIKQLNKDERKTILYTSQPDQIGSQIRYQLAYDFLYMTKVFPSLKFVIKPHPNENDADGYFKKIAEMIGTENYVIDRGDLYKSLSCSSALFVYNSTVASEAIFFDKPIFMMNPKKYDLFEFDRYPGVVTQISTREELKTLIDSLINEEIEVHHKEIERYKKDFNLITGINCHNYLTYIKGVK